MHPLAPDRKLVLGGVEIPYEKGLDGWSDADAVLHAVIDALLGAAGLGDIGMRFPSGDELYKDVSSIYLLGQVKQLLDDYRWNVINVDISILAEQPKMQPYKIKMAENIASVLKIEIGDVNVKAGTNEKMGFVGRGEGIAVMAAVLIEKAEYNHQRE